MRIKAFYLYLAFIFFFAILSYFELATNFNKTSLGITLYLMIVLTAPGLFLARALKTKIKIFISGLFIVLALSLVFYFLLNFLGIIFNLNLQFLIGLLEFFGLLIFLAAVYQDRKKDLVFSFEFIRRFKFADWILIIFSIFFLVLAFLAISAQSGKLIGDGWFHLAIINKIQIMPGLTSANLWSVKEQGINPVYSFPLWNIFMAEISQILNLSAVALWQQSIFALSIIIFLVWFGLIRTLFKSKYLSYFLFWCFLLYYFFGNFYFFAAAVSPDSLNRLIILPIILGLSVYYFFEEEKIDFFMAAIISLLVIFMGFIHITQLLDFVWILIIFVIVALIFYRRKDLFGKIGLLMGILAILVLPYLFIFQRENFLSFVKFNLYNYQTNLAGLRSSPLIFNIYVLFFLPLLLLFFKNKRLTFLAAIGLAIVLISFPIFHLRDYFLKIFGPIFVERAFSDIPNWIFWGLAFYILIFGLNWLLAKTKRTGLLIADFFLLILLFLSLILKPLQNFWIFVNSEIVFNSRNSYYHFIDNHLLLLFLGFLLVSIGLYFYLKKKDIDLFLPKDKLNFVILAISLIFYLSIAHTPDFYQLIKNNQNGGLLKNREMKYPSDIADFGGINTVNFLRSRPQGSVFLTLSVSLAQKILLYGPNYAAEYPYGIAEFLTSQKFYDQSLSEKERLSVPEQLNANYVVLRRAEQRKFLEKYPEKFRLVYEVHSTYQGQNVELYFYQYSR